MFCFQPISLVHVGMGHEVYMHWNFKKKCHVIFCFKCDLTKQYFTFFIAAIPSTCGHGSRGLHALGAPRHTHFVRRVRHCGFSRVDATV